MNFCFIKVCIVTGLLLISISAHTQKKAEKKTVTVTYKWNRIPGHGSNQLAIWVEDCKGNFVNTLFATKFTANGGYKYRQVSLSEWTTKSNLKDLSKEEIDGFTGATQPAGKQTLVWNCMDKSGKIVPEGIYTIRMEANIHDSDKMLYRGSITIGKKNQVATGEITFSKPDLASASVLFSDVVVEYK
jgi:hypothetical protein